MVAREEGVGGRAKLDGGGQRVQTSSCMMSKFWESNGDGKIKNRKIKPRLMMLIKDKKETVMAKSALNQSRIVRNLLAVIVYTGDWSKQLSQFYLSIN